MELLQYTETQETQWILSMIIMKYLGIVHQNKAIRAQQK